MSNQSKKDKERSKQVWKDADKTNMYKTIIEELIDSDMVKIIIAKDENDYAKMVIWTNFLVKYIVQLANDIIEHISNNEWWEESEDMYKKELWLDELCRYGLDNNKESDGNVS